MGSELKLKEAAISAPIDPNVLVSREDSAPFYSRIFLSFLNPLYRIGEKVALEQHHLGGCAYQDQSKPLCAKFDHYFGLEMRKPKEERSLWWVLWSTVGKWKVGLAIFLYALYAGISYVPIIILNELVSYFQGTINLSEGVIWTLVALIFFLTMVGSVSLAHSSVIMAHVGVQFRNVLVNAIYRKALKLSPAARQGSSTGQIVNMFSNDTRQLENCLFTLLNTFVAPFQIVIALVLIYLQVREATFVGLGYMIILFPLIGGFFSYLGSIRRAKVIVTDRRVKLMNEILGGIRIIKYYAWELPFREKVDAIRAEEMVRECILMSIISILYRYKCFVVAANQVLLRGGSWDQCPPFGCSLDPTRPHLLHLRKLLH